MIRVWSVSAAVRAVDAPAKPRAVLATDAVEYSPMIVGGFLEHFNHQVYGGVFDSGSPLADENGFRRDVVEALKELRVPVDTHVFDISTGAHTKSAKIGIASPYFPRVF